MTGLIKAIFGSRNDREVKRLWPRVKEINQIEEGLQKLTDDE
jgi:preprotein translocase subunit SecA